MCLRTLLPAAPQASRGPGTEEGRPRWRSGSGVLPTAEQPCNLFSTLGGKDYEAACFEGHGLFESNYTFTSSFKHSTERSPGPFTVSRGTGSLQDRGAPPNQERREGSEVLSHRCAFLCLPGTRGSMGPSPQRCLSLRLPLEPLTPDQRSRHPWLLKDCHKLFDFPQNDSGGGEEGGFPINSRCRD